jgi:hypothetical protein
MIAELKPQIRLYAILARAAPLAAVFLRGPSKQVLLVLWRTNTDQFYEGRWFKMPLSRSLSGVGRRQL